MAIAKVILNGETQMDVTQKTVTPASMLSGTTALKNDGTDITGEIASKSSSDLTASGATVTAPAGYYASAASKSVASGSASTPATTITANPTVSVNSSGLITASVSKTQNVTPTVSAGYVSSGTAGTITVSGSGTSQLTTQAAQTIHPSTTDQTIASGRYLTGAQTIKAVTTTNLTAANIVQGVTVKVGDSTDDDCVASVTGTASGGGGNDFIITLTKNASTGVYEPDCTYAEMYAAYTGGRTIMVVTANGAPCNIAIVTDPSFNCVYNVAEGGYDAVTGTSSLVRRMFHWTSSGISESESVPAYYTDDATAVPADVASGKVFYNSSGRQVGTASGGGGYDDDYKTLIYRSIGNTTLPDDLTFIGSYAFAQCLSLDLQSLPSGVQNIGGYAFYQCNALKLTSLPSGVTSIGSNAFSNCGMLALTSLPSGLTFISSAAFLGCGRITLSSLPSGITTINANAFSSCTSITLSSLPSGLTFIGAGAFSNCHAITLSSLPSSVTSIGNNAFNCCNGITSISCDGVITTFGYGSFNGSSTYPMQIAHASFPNMTVSSFSYAFGSSTVANACQLLEDADIGNTQSIAANAFANCHKLQTLIIRKSDSICTLANVSAFTNTPIRGYNSLSGTIYVPSALISTYQTATNWSTIYNAGAVTFAAIEGSQYEL